MAHVDTVHQIYQAFRRGDIPAILERLSTDVEWEYGVNSTDVPWLQPRRGRAHITEFFQALAELKIHEFLPKTFAEAGSTVVVLLDFEATVRATNRHFVEEDHVHIWQFDADGQVARFRHRTDTHQQWMAYKGH